MESKEEDFYLFKLEEACSDLRSVLKNSARIGESLGMMDKKFDLIDEALSTASKRVTPLQSLSMAAKALETRINRAVTPALSLLDSFKISGTLQQKLLDISDELSAEKVTTKKRLKKLIKYVECVDQLNAAVSLISQDGEPVIQRLQEVVEFLSRTKATDQYRTHRLRETVVTLKALYETEVDALRFEGSLDQALLNLQDEYESLLQQIKHQSLEQLADYKNNGDKDDMMVANAGSNLGTEIEVEALRRISETLAANDCLDICIDIYVKVRYKRVAKALMRLNPDYLRTYTQEEIDKIEWESLETAIALWIQHFELAVKTVFVSEKKLCNYVLGGLMEGLIWSECFVKIADKIMAVFFRFGEGFTRSSKEPQKLFKLLEMFHMFEKLKPEFSDIFDGESGVDICSRFRELVKLLIHASSKVYWEFGLQIEGNTDGFPPPVDGSVPKIVRYAINYLKYLVTEEYSGPMAKVLQTEQTWKMGILSKPENEENLFRDAIINVMEALQRNVESKRYRYKDKILPHVFAMNTYWYIYMRTRSTELGKLLGDQYMKKKYKIVAEESAYMYQKQAWGPLVRILEKEDLKVSQSKEEIGSMVREKVEAFTRGLNEILNMHKRVYSIPDVDLREQIRESTMALVVSSYTEFLNSFSAALRGRSYFSPETIQGLLTNFFDNGDGKLKRRDFSKDRSSQMSSTSIEGDIKNFRRSGSYTTDV
ncbi:exocyst complex component EXO70I-like [Humulus lupulus]|uniref:exocyst complex component EXO70I-like n=1 Tax=Humulus lupulus TaxID=3486 RepID=UPI002B40E94E|nr:exocyst complex component EXO70I-like [Humulus lupulus]